MLAATDLQILPGTGRGTARRRRAVEGPTSLREIAPETPFALSLSKPVLSDAAGGVEGGFPSFTGVRKEKGRASTGSARTEWGVLAGQDF